MSQPTTKPSLAEPDAHDAVAVVRYQVAQVQRALEFYVQRLGFRQTGHSSPAFAEVSRGALRLLLSGPGSSGARALPDGRQQVPGGYNRIVLFVDSLDQSIESLRAAQVRFRNQVEAGPGGRQIQLEDPDGNPIELHELPAAP
jgi:catechol 2,3-dioxygenase-like lactoylglutathione lyase family enzyme